MSRIPEIYKPATLRAVTSIEAGLVGVSVDIVGSREVLRFRLSISDAITIGHLTKSHSDGSPDIPSSEVSNSSPVSE